MAKATTEVISALRHVATRIEQSNDYQWGHMGSCNCGFLAQYITPFPKEDIHRRAMEGYGDWSEQLNDYCATSGRAMDDLIRDMLAFGFDADDLRNLERLSDEKILRTFPIAERALKHNVKADVVRYLRAWADDLDAEKLVRDMLLHVRARGATTIL